MRPPAGGEAQVAEQAIRAQAGEPHAVERRELRAAQRQYVDLQTRGVVSERVERSPPIRVEVRRWLDRLAHGSGCR